MAQYELPSFIRTLYFQVEDIDLTQGGFPAHLSYQFPALQPMSVDNLTRVLHSDILLYGIAGGFSGQGDEATGVFVNLYHVHNGGNLPIVCKPVPIGNLAGSGQLPFPVRPTYLIQAGDALACEVRSQDKINPLNVELDLFGTTVNWAGATKAQKLVLQSKIALLNALQPPNIDAWGDDPPPSAMPLVQGPLLQPYPNPGAAPVVIFSYQVPPGQRARIFEHALQHVGGNPPELSNSGVIWRFLVNQWPLQGLGTQTAQIGAFATPDKVVIWLTENDLFQVTVEIPATGSTQSGLTGYRANGWTAPLTAAASCDSVYPAAAATNGSGQ